MMQQVHVKQELSSNVEALKERIKRMKSLELMSKPETLSLRMRHVGPSVALFFADDPLKMVAGSGQHLYDELGNEYLDCINNVAHVGHANEHVQETVSRQLGLLYTNSRFLHDNLSSYAHRLCSLFPAHLSVCYMVNSGSEANDLAIRLARAFTGRKDIMCLEGAYHGNLTSTMAISPYKTQKGATRPKWAHVAPLPCAYRGPLSLEASRSGLSEPEVGRLYAASCGRLINDLKKNHGRRLAAFFLESMISCGGQSPLPADYLRQVQRLLRAEGALLVCDEVQSGFGRSGSKMWAFQLDGDDIKPDIVTVGKAMGNGFPVAAVVTTRAVAEAFRDIGTEFFNTFGGNAASCAAANAVLDELERGKLMQNAKQVGSWMLEELKRVQKNSKILGDVRGVGFFIGLDMVKSRESRLPAPEFARHLVQRFREERILMSTEGKHGNVLKFKPPMVFNMDDARRFLGVFERALGELEALIQAGGITSGCVGGQKGEKAAAAAAEAAAGNRQSTQSNQTWSSASSAASTSSWMESSDELCDDE